MIMAVINLVPLPPFDGAGIATTLYEAARRALADRITMRSSCGSR